jgi:O-antigen ligase
MFLVFLLVCAAVPLLITPGLLFHYDTAPKVIILAIAAALALLRLKKGPSEAISLWSRPAGRWLVVISACQLIWFGITTATSSRPWLSLFGSNWRRFGLVELASLLIVGVAVAGSLSARPEQIRTVLRMTVFAGLISSIYGILQYFGIDPFQPTTAYQAHAGDSIIVRTPGTLGHADYFGWWLAIAFFCALALRRIDSSLWKHVSTAAAICMCVAVLLSGTRAALLAIVIGVASMAPSRIRIRRRHVLTALAAAIVFAVFLASDAGALLRARAVWSQDEPAGGARPLLWRDSLRMAAAKPLLGYGPETFLTAFAPHQSESLSRMFPDFHHESPHNVPLDALTATGIPGLLIIVAWAALGGYAAVSARRAGAPIAVPLTAVLLASATAAAFSGASLAPLLLTLLVIACLIAVCPEETQPSWETRSIVRYSASALATCTALSLLVFAGLLAVSEFRMERFRAHPDEAAYQSVLKAALPGAGEDLYVSRVLQQQCGKGKTLAQFVMCWQQSMRAAGRALNTADDVANAWYSLATLSAAQNNEIGTRRGLIAAIQVSPNWFKPHWALARLLSQTGETQQALSEAARAAFLDSNRDPEVVETLTQLTARRR